MGKFKRMGNNYSKDVIVCPDCEGIFVQRAKGKVCPFCKIKLVYPGEYFSPMTKGFYWSNGTWEKICDLNIGEGHYCRNK